MRRWFLLALALLTAIPSVGQTSLENRVLYASDFGRWTIPQGSVPALGGITWPTAALCTTISEGNVLKPLRVGRTIRIVDADPTLSENVVITAVREAPFCSIAATMQNAHTSYTVQSATGGLQEAIDSAGTGNAAVVVLTPSWSNQGYGDTTVTTTTRGSANVSILDMRSSNLGQFTLSGGSYVYAGFGGGGPGGGITCSQGFTGGDLSGTVCNPTVAKIGGVTLARSATVDATNAGNINSGTLDVARVPTLPATKISGLSTVATTGSYADLLNKPTIPTIAAVTTILKGNGANGAVAALPGDILTLLNAPSNNTTFYLRADGVWAAPPGTGGGGGPPSGSAGGDLTGSYPNPGVGQVNGAAPPQSATVVATNSSRQLIQAPTNSIPFTLMTGKIGLAQLCDGTPTSGSYCDPLTRQWTALPNNAASSTNPMDPLYLAGGVPIYDGNAHTYSEVPSGAQCGGYTTYAGLANCVVNGVKPFAYLADTGAVYGDKCTKGTTNRNCMLDEIPANVLNLPWAQATSQATLLTQHVLQLRSGVMIWDKDFLFPICTQYDLVQCYEINGAGRTATIIRPVADAGLGHWMITGGDWTANQANGLGAWAGNAGQTEGMVRNVMLDFPGSNGGQPHSLANGGPTNLMGGIRRASRMDLENFWVRGFNDGIGEVGDHWVENNTHELLNWNCRHWLDKNYQLYGDGALHDDTCNAYYAGALVAPSASISVGWSGKSYSSGMYWIVGEAGNACAFLMSGVHVESMHLEYTNLGVITEQNALPGYNGNGTAYHPEKTCRPLQDVDVQVYQLAYNPGNDKLLTQGFPNLYRNFTIMSGGIHRVELKGLDIGGLNPDPNQSYTDPGTGQVYTRFGGVDASGVSIGAGFLLAPQIGQFHGGMYMSGAMNDFFAGFKYQLYKNNNYNGSNGGFGTLGSFTFEQVGQFKGIVDYMPVQGNYTKTRQGDLVEVLNFDNNVLAPAGTNFGNDFFSPAIGVQAQDGLTLPSTVAVKTWASQYTPVNLDWEYDFHWHNLVFTNTGIRGLIIANAGTGITNGTYSWSADCSGGGTQAQGTITATNGSWSSYTMTAFSSKCTAVPTVNIAGTPGGSGWIVLAAWPSGTGRSPNLSNVGTGLGPYYGWGQAFFGTKATANFGLQVQINPGSR